MTEGFSGEGSPTDDPVVTARVVRRFNAPVERVFDAWLDQRSVGRWLFATADGTVVRAELDPRVGGRYTIVDNRAGEDALHTGKYLEIDRPRRLMFTLAVDEDSTAADRVTVEFEPRGERESELAITHVMDPEYAEFVERTETGWRGVLDRLAEVVA